MGQVRYVAEMPLHMECFEGIELARGYFDEIAYAGSELLVHGWLLLPDKEFSSIRVYWNGELLGAADVELRSDIANVFPWIPHADRSGFRLRLHKPTFEATGIGRFDVLGCQDGRPICRLGLLYRRDLDLDTNFPVPPAELMERVMGCQNPRWFKIGGLNSFAEFVDAINRHCELRSVRRLLDWGCGSGRVTVHFLLQRNMAEVFGCDIDPDGIAWCSDHLRPGNFSRIDPWPPTPYNDATFDLVIAYSVFTHLARDIQKAWLAEMTRIIAPGGLFLASTHGDFAAAFAFPKPLGDSESPHGIFDGMPDSALKGIAPKDYYRGVFQTREYTLREWSKYFDILEYVERGMGNFQDLVVMRRPA